MTGDILGIVAQIVLLIFVGALLRRMQVLRVEHASLLNSLVINLTLPATVFLAIRKLQGQDWQSLLKVVLVAYLVIGASGLVAYLFSRLLRLERRTIGAFIIVAMLGSTAFLGYPLVEGLFRPANLPECSQLSDPACAAFCEEHSEECNAYARAVGAAAFYSEMGTLIPILTVAVVIASRYGEGERFSWRNLLAVLKFGPFVALLIGLLFYNDAIPDVIVGMLKILQSATVPLIMLSLGITISWGDFFGRHFKGILAVNVIKLLLAPGLALLLAGLLGISGEVRSVTVLMSALPSLMICLSYANQYKLDIEFASNALFASFFLGVVTLPVVAYFISTY
ncbi:MAG: AEC family transporter [Chloroflexia bacterium]|nr:AEC family transporter [Chloroflexia bacterium]